jgi:hypothetical protein
MGKTFKELREDNNKEEDNKNGKGNKGKYSKGDKIRFALKEGTNNVKILMRGKIVDPEFIETRKPIHR